MAASDFTINITGKVTNLKDLAKVTKEMTDIEKKIQKSSKNMAGFNAKIKKNLSVSQQGLAGLGNKLGFVAFQWTFIASRAGLAFQQMTQGIRQVVQDGAELEDKLIRIRIQADSLTGGFGSSVKNANFLTDAVLDIGTTGGVEIGRLAEGAEALTKVFSDFDDVSTVLPGFAKILLLEEDINPETLAQGLKAGNIAFGEMNEILAIASVVADNTGLSVETFLNSIGRAGLQARLFGADSKQLAVTLGVIGDTLKKTTGQQAGIFAGRLFENLGEGLDTTTERGQMAANLFKALGVDLVDTAGNFNDITVIMRQLQTGMSTLSESDQQLAAGFLFGEQRAKLGALALLNTDIDEMEKAIEDLNNAQDITNRKFQVLSKSAKSQMQNLENSVTTMKALIVNGMAPAIQELNMLVRGLFEDDEFKQGLNDLGRIMAEEVLPVLKIMLKLVIGLFKAITKNKDVLRILIKAVTLFAFALGALAIIGQVVALMAVLGAVMQKFGSQAVLGTTTNAIWGLNGSLAGTLKVMKFVGAAAIGVIAGLFAIDGMIKLINGEKFNAEIATMTIGLSLLAVAMGGVVAGPVGAAATAGILAGAFAALSLSALSDKFAAMQELADEFEGLPTADEMIAMRMEEAGQGFLDSTIAGIENELKLLAGLFDIDTWIPPAFGEDGKQVGMDLGKSFNEGLASTMDFFGIIGGDLNAAFENLGIFFDQIGTDLANIFGDAWTNFLDFVDWITTSLMGSEQGLKSLGEQIGDWIINGIMGVLGPLGSLITFATGFDFASLMPSAPMAFGEESNQAPIQGPLRPGEDLGMGEVGNNGDELSDGMSTIALSIKKTDATFKKLEKESMKMKKHTVSLSESLGINDSAVQGNTATVDANSLMTNTISATGQVYSVFLKEAIKISDINSKATESLSNTLASGSVSAVNMFAAADAHAASLASAWMDSEGKWHYTKHSGSQFRGADRAQALENQITISNDFADLDRIDISKLEEEIAKALLVFNSATIQSPFFATGGKDPNAPTVDPMIAAFNALNETIRALNLSFEEASHLAETRGLSLSQGMFDAIPQMAKGGIVNGPTLALIGEGGPEAVVPLGGSGFGGGSTFDIDIEINIDSLSNDVDVDDMVDRVSSRVVEKLEGIA